MMQSKQIVASLFQTVLNMFKYDAIKTNYCITFINAFKLSFYLFKKWCNQNKLLQHYFQTGLNMFKIWYNQNKLLHHYFKQFWTCLNMMQSKQIIASLLSILSKQVFIGSKDDAVSTSYCITIFIWTGLAWAGLASPGQARPAQARPGQPRPAQDS